VSRIVFELEAEGFTHLACRCGGCGETITLSFAEVRNRTQHGSLASLDELAPKLACEGCPGERAVEMIPQRHARAYRGGPLA
jgi:hypothetical protein